MPLTYHYFKNPFGKGVSTGASGALFETYSRRYFEAIQNDLDCLVGFEKKEQAYIIKFDLPSEQNPEYEKKLFYDVVFYIKPPTPAAAEQTQTIKEYEIYVYSNQISFTFTYTHALNKSNSLISWIPTRFYHKDALKLPATKRNPNDDVYFDKGLWYCMFYITNNKLENKANLDSVINSKCNRSYVLNNIRSQIQMIEMRNTWDQKYKIKKEKEVDRGYDKQKYDGIRNKNAYMAEQKMKAKMKADTQAKHMKSSLKPKVRNRK